jgi:hypothetical protein
MATAADAAFLAVQHTHTLAHPLGARGQVVEGLLYATTGHAILLS